MKEPRKLADTLVSELRNTLGDRLRAASLFGSAARGEWIEGVSDVNVLVLIDDIDAPVLGRVAPAVRKAAAANVRPLLMELAEWRRAADVFTIELADMQDANVPMFGDDPTAGASIRQDALRFQAEHELRGKLLHLHSGMIMTADQPKRLGELLMHALPSFTTYMRAALRLAGQTVPTASRDVIAQACALVGTSDSALLRVLDARTAKSTLSIGLDDAVADDYNTAVEQLAAYIDAFGRNAP